MNNFKRSAYIGWQVQMCFIYKNTLDIKREILAGKAASTENGLQKVLQIQKTQIQNKCLCQQFKSDIFFIILIKNKARRASAAHLCVCS